MSFVNIPHTLLRDKTEETIKSFLNRDRDCDRFPIVSSATGTGKSWIALELILEKIKELEQY